MPLNPFRARRRDARSSPLGDRNRPAAGDNLKLHSVRRALALATTLMGIGMPDSLEAQIPGQRRAEGSASDSVVLSIGDVQRLTLARNPSFLADRQESAIARGGLRQAGLLRFNPELSVASPGTGSTSLRNPVELTVLQEIELAGQRGLRRDAAQAGVTRAEAGVANSARLGVADVSRTFYRALATERRLAVTRDGLALTTRLMDAVRTQLGEGEISVLEGTLAEIEFGRAKARVLEAERLASGSLLELKRLVGIDATTLVRLEDPLAPPPVFLAGLPSDSLSAVAARADTVAAAASGSQPSGQLPDPAALDADSLMHLALSQRPDLAASTVAVQELETLTALARRETLPNLRVGALAERVPNEGGLRLGPAIGVSLPFWNRNQGVIAQRRAQLQQSVLERRAAEARVRTDVEIALRAYRAATQEAATYESTVRQPARVNSVLLETAFRAGKIALPTLLLLRNQLVEAELGYWDAWLARQDALVQLDAATGLLARERLRASDATSPSSPRTSR